MLIKMKFQSYIKNLSYFIRKETNTWILFMDAYIVTKKLIKILVL